MENYDRSFDGFLKKVISRDSHPIYYSFLSKRHMLKMLLIDSMISGMIFGLYRIRAEIDIKRILNSWAMMGKLTLLTIFTNMLSFLMN